jgi:osmotically-inducible protein OsmY
MANQQGNGRRVAMPDENQPSWRPQDEGDRRMRDDDDDRDWDRQRSTESYGQGQSGYGAGRYEEDRSYGSQASPGMPRERTDERFAGGGSPQNRGYAEQSGYGQRGYGGDDHRERGMRGRDDNERSGRYGDDDDDRGVIGRRGHYGSRGMSGRGSWGNERSYSEGSYQGRGSYGNQGRGGFGAQGQGGFGQHLDRGQSYYGQQGYGGSNYLGQGGQQMGEQAGGRGVQGHGGLYGQGGYNEGMYGDRESMQHRYGSQGYQGWGQDQHGQQTYGDGARAGRQGVHQGVHGVQGGHRGKGPAGYQRSDDRIRELVCEALTDHDHIDATNIEINVKNGEVTLTGTVEDRRQKRLAEDIVEELAFVKDVLNQLRIGSPDSHKRQDTRGGQDATKNGTSKDLSSNKSEDADRRHKA